MVVLCHKPPTQTTTPSQNGKLHLENLRIMGTAPPQNWQVRPLGPLTNRRRRLHSAIRSEDILSAVVLLGNVQAQFINVDFVGTCWVGFAMYSIRLHVYMYILVYIL